MWWSFCPAFTFPRFWELHFHHLSSALWVLLFMLWILWFLEFLCTIQVYPSLQLQNHPFQIFLNQVARISVSMGFSKVCRLAFLEQNFWFLIISKILNKYLGLDLHFFWPLTLSQKVYEYWKFLFLHYFL